MWEKFLIMVKATISVFNLMNLTEIVVDNILMSSTSNVLIITDFLLDLIKSKLEIFLN